MPSLKHGPPERILLNVMQENVQEMIKEEEIA